MKIKIFISYKIEKGDSLYLIAKKHNVRWKEDIYNLPINAEFRKYFPDPAKINYSINGKPVSVYVLTNVEWDEKKYANIIRKFLPPYFSQNDANKKIDSSTKNERSIGIVRSDSFNVCANYEIVPYKGSLPLPPLGPLIQVWTWEFKIRAPVLLNANGDIVFDQAHVNANNTISITKEADSIGISVLGHLSASFDLEGIVKVGLSGLAGQGISLSAKGELSYTIEREIAGEKYEIEFTLRTDIDYSRRGYLKIGFKYIGDKRIYCGIQDESWIAVEWKFLDLEFAMASTLVPAAVYSWEYQGYRVLVLELADVPVAGSPQRVFQQANQEAIGIVLLYILWYSLNGIKLPQTRPLPAPVPIR